MKDIGPRKIGSEEREIVGSAIANHVDSKIDATVPKLNSCVRCGTGTQ